MSPEVQIESGSPVPAQRAARLPYETPTMEILLDTSVPYPRDPNFGASSTVGRFEPISPVVDTYASQPKGLFDKITEGLARAGAKVAQPVVLTEIAVGGVAGAAVITIVQPQVPSAEASGNRMLVTASAEGTAECVTDPNLMTINREFADKIASGKIVIAMGGPPIAALEEGDKTAEVITSISVEEALKNLIIPAPACEPKPIVKLPTAAETFDKIITQDKKEIKSIKLSTIKRGILGSERDPKQKGFWDKYSSELEQMQIILWDPGAPLSKRVFEEELSIIEGTFPGMGKDVKMKMLGQIQEAGVLSVMFLAISDRTENREMKLEAHKIADQLFDYGVLGIHPRPAYAKSSIIDNMLLNGPKLFTYDPQASN